MSCETKQTFPAAAGLVNVMHQASSKPFRKKVLAFDWDGVELVTDPFLQGDDCMDTEREDQKEKRKQKR